MSASAEWPLTIAEIEGRGRALVSTLPLEAGQIILRDSPILLYSALPFTIPHNPSSFYCQHCFRTLQSSLSSSFSICPSCSSLFCSGCLTSSSSSSFSSSHSPYICQALTRLKTRQDLPLERQVQARFLIAAYNLALVNPTQFQVLLSLQGNVSGNDDSAAHCLHSLISTLCPPASAMPSVEVTAALLAKDRLNAFGLMEAFGEDRDGERSVRAYGIYPKASLFNHDCLPNACRFDYVDAGGENNTDIVVRMIHDVPQGREICLSYFPVNLDYSTRQKRLLEDYGFACDCDRCKVEVNWSDNENGNDNDKGTNDDEGGNEEEEEEEEMMDEDEGEQMVASEGENGGDNDFPHAYFFMRYMCNRNNCWGTLAPLPPSDSDGIPSTVMECNVCGSLKNDDAIGGEDSVGMDD